MNTKQDKIKYKITGLQLFSDYNYGGDEAFVMLREKVKEALMIEEQIALETLRDSDFAEYLTSPLEDQFERVQNNHEIALYLPTDGTKMEKQITNFTAQYMTVLLDANLFKQPLENMGVIEFLSTFLEYIDEVIESGDYLIGVTTSCVYEYDVDLTSYNGEDN